MQKNHIRVLIIAIASAAACGAPAADRLTVPESVVSTPLGFAISNFYPRQTLVIDAPDSLVGGDSVLTVTSPVDTERVVMRPYPAPCDERRGCALIDFMWGDGGGWAFFTNTGDVARWHAAMDGGPDERRGIIYAPVYTANAIHDTVEAWTMFATTARIVGRAGHRHATLHTTDAFMPGASPSDQPVVRGDGVLHVATGDTVTVTGASGAARIVVEPTPSLPAAHSVSDGSLRTAGGYAVLQVSTPSFNLAVPVTFTNHTGATVLLSPCPRFTLQKWTDLGWRGAMEQVCLTASPMRFDSIPPNATRVDTFVVRGQRLPRAAPRFAIDPIPGDYRFDYILIDASTGKEIDERSRVSNVFKVLLLDPAAIERAPSVSRPRP